MPETIKPLKTLRQPHAVLGHFYLTSVLRLSHHRKFDRIRPKKPDYGSFQSYGRIHERQHILRFAAARR